MHWVNDWINTQTKQCVKCKLILSLDSFHIQSTGRFGRNNKCKECRNSEVRIKRRIKRRKREAQLPKKDNSGIK